MKTLRKVFIGIFFILLFIPVLCFNRKEDVVSEIDNRMLRKSPFETEEGEALSDSIEAYVEDRIGLRDEMIAAYTKVNDVLFGEMIHPSYEYGKDGYVFAKSSGRIIFEEYHVVFAQMVDDLQTYCEEKGVPFLFAITPSKESILRNKLPVGYYYNNDWVPLFFEELEKRGVNYVDITPLLCDKEAQEEAVFNRQYDARHWNDLGAYYGTNKILETLGRRQDRIHINDKSEFDIGTEAMTSLLVSEFKINEEVPVFTRKCNIIDLTEEWDSVVERNERYSHFRYTMNPERKEEGAPKALVFQGSYMNAYGAKFFENSFGEYIAVHNYENVINMEYYFEMFQPDCVIFEVTEWTVLNAYFSYNAMVEMVKEYEKN